ncbi:hypothetical protein ACO0OE_002080 [Hanseniaspora uvarum]
MAKSANGTTYKIRESLQFLDNKKWKLFSTRRLELIDRFKLFEKKASEQDCNIERIANILRTEFDYSIEHQVDFEKLVTAAVQSVRRNRKRSKNLNMQSGATVFSDQESPKTESSSLMKIKTSQESPVLSNNSPIESFLIPSASSLSHNNINKHKSVTVSVAASQRNSNSDSDSNKFPSPSVSPISSPLQLARTSPSLYHNSLHSILPSAAASSSTNHNNSLFNNINHELKNNKFSPVNGSLNNDQRDSRSHRISLPSIQNMKPKNINTEKRLSSPKIESSLDGVSIETVKNIIADIVYQRVSVKEQISKTSANKSSTSSSSTLVNTPTTSDISLEFFAMSSHNMDLLPVALNQKNQETNKSTLPSISSFLKTKKEDVDTGYNCPYFLKSKILIPITNSKTCHDICSKQGSYKDLYQTVLSMGDMGYKSSLLFVFERFYGTNSTMVSYLKEKLLDGEKAEERLIQVLENIFKDATLRSFYNLKPEFKMDLFKLCIGALIKDFGFDPVIYPLGEIFQDYILKELSLFLNANQNNASLNPNNDSNYNSNSDLERKSPSLSNGKDNSEHSLAHNMIVSTAPLNPSMANNAIHRTVLIKKGLKQQEFTFYPLSNGCPTISEILENCTLLFGLNSNHSVTERIPTNNHNHLNDLLQKGDERNVYNFSGKNSLNNVKKKYGLYHNNNILKSDIELSTLLTNFVSNSKEIVLEIKEYNINSKYSNESIANSPEFFKKQKNDGLSILSCAAFVSSNQQL